MSVSVSIDGNVIGKLDYTLNDDEFGEIFERAKLWCLNRNRSVSITATITSGAAAWGLPDGAVYHCEVEKPVDGDAGYSVWLEGF